MPDQERWPPPWALVLVTAVLVVLATTGRAVGEPSDCPICRSVTIAAENVYHPDEPAARTFYGRLANSLHVRTHDGVIRRALFFREGRPVCPEDIAASVRRLRTYPFLHSNIEINGFEEADSVDLIVRTRDSWTTKLETAFKKEGGLLVWSVGAWESNFLGLGKSVTIGVGHDEELPFWRAGFSDPQVLGSAVRASLSLSRGDEGLSTWLRIARPFERATIERGFCCAFENLATRFTDHRLGLNGPQWDLDSRELMLRAGARVAGGEQTALRVSPALYWLRERYASPSDARLPAKAGETTAGPLVDQDICAPGVALEYEHERYVELSGIEAFEHREDWNLGTAVFAQVGYSPRDFTNARDAACFRVSLRQGLPFSEGRFVLASMKAQGQFAGGAFHNTLLSGAVRYYGRMSDRQTLAFQLRGDWGVRLLPQDAITLGAESGLRGFDAYDFWGERAAVMNLEDRVTLAEDFLGLVSVGMSAFADVGSIWRAGHRDEARLRVAAGLGLRVLSSRTSRRVATRIDAGLPLIGAEDHAGFIVSIGSDPDF